jgi:hypothetical protein
MGGEDDERLASHVEVHHWAVRLAHVVEVKPLEAFGELMDITDEGDGFWSWREGETFGG